MHLLDHLLSEYGKLVVRTVESEQTGSVSHFVDFAKQYLEKNPIISTAIVDVGIGLRFQTGEVVDLAAPRKEIRPNVAISISDTAVNPATHGITDTRAVNVTDPNK